MDQYPEQTTKDLVLYTRQRLMRGCTSGRAATTRLVIGNGPC